MTRAIDPRSAGRYAWAVLPALCGVAIVLAFTGSAMAYPNYEDPAAVGLANSNCASCHPGFVKRDETHDLHVGPITNSCNLCHSGSNPRNPFLMWSDDGTDPYGCMGCHGGSYGETIELANGYSNNGSDTFNLNGLPKQSGYGTRKQHLQKGVTVCLSCHADVPRSFLKPESTTPVYYPRSDTNPSDPCSSSDEDSSPEIEPCPVGACSITTTMVCRGDADCPSGETCSGIVPCANPYTGNEDSVGLDNDGEALDNPTTPRIDVNDPDCALYGGVKTPGEAGAPVGGGQMLVTAADAAGNITISFGAACSATNHSVYAGPLTAADMRNGNYTQAFCGVGSTSPTFNVGTGDVFFLAVGENGTNEGSYGESYYRDSTDTSYPGFLIYRERAPDAAGTCGRPQSLVSRCD